MELGYQFYRLFNQCTVRLSVPGGDAEDGTGFFVAPGLVLTCAHVVEAAQSSKKTIAVYWKNDQFFPGTIVKFLPASASDLALVQVELAGHPCVYLREEALPFTDVYSYGYPIDTVGGASATFSLEGEAGKYDEQLEFKAGQLRIGMSGAPILNKNTGYVCAIAQLTHHRSDESGGNAMSIAAVFQALPDLAAQNRRFHSQNHDWEFARLAGSSPLGPEAATRHYLHLVSEFVAKRPVFVPTNRGIADVRQIPSVRVVRDPNITLTSFLSKSDYGNSSAVETSFLSKSDHSNSSASDSLDGDDGIFRWIPLQMPRPTVVLSGDPGSGKSCLLNLHTDTYMRDSTRRLDKGDSQFSIPIPVLVDCSVLGQVLKEVPTQETVIEALVDTIYRQLAVALPHMLPDEGISAVLKLAYRNGHLVICLDALDEADGPEQQRVLQALSYLTGGGNKLVITFRPDPRLRVDTMHLEHSLRAQVIGFSSGQVYNFVHLWFADAPELAEKFEAEMRGRPELQELARVPLLAAFLCRLVSIGKDLTSLSSERAQLYRAVVDEALSGQLIDHSRQIYAPPDPEHRLSILIHAIGTLSRGWRSRIDRFLESDLEEIFAEHPKYKRAERKALARRKEWQSHQPHDRLVPDYPAHVLWEYLFDGLFAYDTVSGHQRTLRFTHPVFGEYCIAKYVSQLSQEDLEQYVHEHQWFDSSWEQIWSLSAALMDDPDRLVKLFLQTKPDAWREQTFLAAQCVVGAAGRVAKDLQKSVVTAVGAGVSAPRLFDRERALAQLQNLVRVGTSGSTEIGRIIMKDPTQTSRTRLRVVAMLAERKDPEGLMLAREILVDSAILATYRSWLARAVVIAEDAEGLKALKAAIKGGSSPAEMYRLLGTIPIETRSGGDFVSDVLRDSTLPVEIRAAAGRALIRLGDPQRTKLTKEVATDPVVTVWTLRAALISELLAVGEDDVIIDGLIVVKDPNISSEFRIELLEKLIWRDQTDVLPLAINLLQSPYVDWQKRKRLARAVVGLRDIGVPVLRSLVDSSLSIDLKVRPLVALIEAGEAIERAVQIVHGSTKAPSWVRTRLACTLLEIGYLSIASDVLVELVTTIEPDNELQLELIVAMARWNISVTESAALLLLRQAATTTESQYTDKREMLNGLGSSGSIGLSLLSAIAKATELKEEDRALAIVELAENKPESASHLFTEFLDQFTPFVQWQLVFLLAEKGLAEVADELNRRLQVHPEALTALYKLLNSPRSKRELVNLLLNSGDAVDKVIRVPLLELKIDKDFLTSCGLSGSSEAEYRVLQSEVRARLELMVGKKLIAFLTMNQRDEFAELMPNEEEGLEFLQVHVPGYQQLVEERMIVLRDQLREHPIRIKIEKIPLMQQLAHRAAVIGEWLDVTHRGGEAQCAAFLEANQRVIVSEEGLALLSVADQVNGQTIDYVALHYIVTIALNEDISMASDFVRSADRRHDVYCTLLADRKGEALVCAGWAGVLLTPQSPVPDFYAALGLIMIDNVNTGVEWMMRSGKKATSEARQQGCNTIRDAGKCFGWDSDLIQTLVDALDSGQNDA